MYITTFRVRGKGPFPLDMLRYDQCWPHTPLDVENMNETHERDIVIAKAHPYRTGGNLTVERWNSFGWAVHLGLSAKV